MKTITKALFVAGLVGAAAVGADPGQNVVYQAQSMHAADAERLSSPVVPAKQALTNFLREQGIRQGSTTEGDNVTIINIQSARTNVASYSADFMDLRDSLAVEAQLMAKANIIESISSDAKALRSVVKFSNPVMKQIAQKENIYRQAIAAQRRQAEQAQKDVALLLEGVDRSQADLIRGATFSDKLMSLLDAGIKKLDDSYDPSTIDEAKQKKLEDLKQRLKLARQAEKDAVAAKNEIEAKEAELVDNKKKEVSSRMALAANMPLFGATVIASADSYDELKGGVLEVAVAMVWSTRLEDDAKKVFNRQGNGEPRPTKLSLNEWLDSQDLAIMVGPRRYLASDGSINFLGISAVEMPFDDAEYSAAVIEAELFAKQGAVLSMLSEVTSDKAAQKTRVDRKVDGKVAPEVYKNIAIEMKATVEANVNGLEIIRTVDTVHPATGKEIIVAVANLNSALAHKSESIMAETYALLKEFNADQSVKVGVKAGMEAAAETTRNNEQLIQQGRNSGTSAVNEKYEDSTRPTTQTQSATKSGAVADGSGTAGTFINKGTLERDF
ncbi:hypothetical protein GH975_06220 [Litorivicinus lipolyticus]|uniref:Uncharacterized protein n=1 Tax=Litorivicinus lipolyticus TaxID=418701 RepID=A0A5Q2QCX7_9GAMM|nr:hypothetical protein [Litorivicinus lipolyticus]QGG80191.1 hypothetical protein GH975_06220 [Litorivicinus lipolyticus]